MRRPSPPVAFIVGAPRSGTTIMGRVLEAHPAVAHLYEPYYLWYWHAKDLSSDAISPEEIGERESAWIRSRFEDFGRRLGKELVIDKSPEHSLNLRIVAKTFPEAKFIHMLRDGRDVVLSTKKEWAKRQAIVEGRSFRKLLATVSRMMKRQPLWRFRWLSLYYELKTTASLNPLRYLNKGKWEGKVGWGIRFEGWQKALAEEPLIRFHALQWLHCVKAIERDRLAVPTTNWLEVRYEDLVSESSSSEIERVLEFLSLPDPSEFRDRCPEIRLGNTKKWGEELSPDEIAAMEPALEEKLEELGYDVGGTRG